MAASEGISENSGCQNLIEPLLLRRVTGFEVQCQGPP